MEEAVLQVSDWGFNLGDLQVQKQQDGGGLFLWFKSIFHPSEKEWAGFLGPIHVWQVCKRFSPFVLPYVVRWLILLHFFFLGQGMDDRVVPPSMTEYVRRVVPGATVHRLLDEGHFSYFCFCDECHRQVFSTLFGIPQGPLPETVDEDPSPSFSPLAEGICETTQNCTLEESEELQ